ncbi:glycoside hydrolase family 3 N-terminal domain-containing protein [Lacticaseibacillus daqingensis]|uniref:glycoside hydrolase family 3 N-terminal domain-containing protein n=1 Tax=Lacticaseibacillus daqingensis TaxID=2486014 RepID=UPI001CDCC79C|nr:glycoside hydrolase family 3 N-terminal domain-containing protein [Lacticaseibacillus daqingensis]
MTASVKVTNTGKVAGKDVVQLYYSAPYTATGIEKSAVTLGAFGKTKTLAPGASQTVKLSMNFDDMASFDQGANGCYVLDKGQYQFSLRTDAHDQKSPSTQFTYDQPKRIIYNNKNDGKRSTDKVVAKSQKEFQDAGKLETNMTYLSRKDFSGTFPKVERRLNPTKIPAKVKERLNANGPGSTVFQTVQKVTKIPTTGAQNGLKINDLKGVAYNSPKWEKLVQEMSLSELTELTGNAGWQTSAIDSIGKKQTIDIDGPQGLNGFNFSGTKMNTYTSEVLMGMTWNKTLVHKMGKTYAKEALSWGIVGLYAPAMNTHRSPFGGRNFEYYSEDPTLSGELAVQEINGMQGEGTYVYAKHYLLNTQDTNRDGAANWCNEQTIREIYARPFELATKQAHVTGMMTELSRIGASWSSATYALCTEMPRNEWGYKGKIITDGVGPGGSYYMLPDYAVLAGNDMMLTRSSGNAGYTDKTLKTSTGVANLQRAAKNILYVYVNSKASQVSGKYNVNWQWGWILGNVVLAALMLGSFVLLPYRAWCLNGKGGKQREK